MYIYRGRYSDERLRVDKRNDFLRRWHGLVTSQSLEKKGYSDMYSMSFP